MAWERIGDLFFDGARGTIESAHKQMDYYTRLGDDKIYLQQTKIASKASTIQAWKVFDNLSEAESFEASVKKAIGVSGLILLSTREYHSNGYVIDYTHSVKQMAGDKVLSTYNITVVVDERET